MPTPNAILAGMLSYTGPAGVRWNQGLLLPQTLGRPSLEVTAPPLRSAQRLPIHQYLDARSQPRLRYWHPGRYELRRRSSEIPRKIAESGLEGQELAEVASRQADAVARPANGCSALRLSKSASGDRRQDRSARISELSVRGTDQLCYQIWFSGAAGDEYLSHTVQRNSM